MFPQGLDLMRTALNSAMGAFSMCEDGSGMKTTDEHLRRLAVNVISIEVDAMSYLCE